MHRREFISLIGGAATAWPLAARAQRRAKPARIGYLSSSSPPDVFLESFIRGMGVVGYVEGRDFVLEARYAGRDYTNSPRWPTNCCVRKSTSSSLAAPLSDFANGCRSGFCGVP